MLFNFIPIRVSLGSYVIRKLYGLPMVIKVIIGKYHHGKCDVCSDMSVPKCRSNFAASHFTIYPYYNRITSKMHPSF
jgi:hypothetical protein